jgi:hypothetical protein
MRQVLAIAEREFVERKLVLAAGTVLAVLTLFTPWLPGVEGFTKGDVIGLASTGVSLTVLFIGALVMGMTSINADLSERRLGFYFSRPISGLEIWLGKVAGTLAVVIVTAFITFLPAATGDLKAILETEPRWIAFFAWCVLGVFFVGHVTACAARVRSVWLLLDFAGVFLLVASGWAMFRFYYGILPLDALGRFIATASLWAIVAAILIAMLASALGVLSGSVEPGRVHLWTSLALWTLTAIVLAGVWAFSIWISRAEPTEMRLTSSDVWYPGGSDGAWMAVSDRSRGGVPQSFALRDGDHFLRLGSREPIFLSETRAIASQPEVVFRFRPDRYLTTETIALADPSSGGGWAETKISYDVRGPRPDVSPSGNRVAVVDKGTVAVYSLPDEKMLRAISLDLGRGDTVAMLDDERVMVRFRERTGQNRFAERYRYELMIFHVASGSRQSAVAFEGSGFVMAPDGRHALVKNGVEQRIIDLEDGTALGSFESPSSVYATRWMSSGEIAIPEFVDGQRSMRLVNRSGEETERIDLGLDRDHFFWLGREPRPGVLTAVTAPSSAIGNNRCSGRTLLEIDIAGGRVREVEQGVSLIWSYNRNIPVGSPATRTFYDCDGRIVRYDENLETREVVLGRR